MSLDDIIKSRNKSNRDSNSRRGGRDQFRRERGDRNGRVDRGDFDRNRGGRDRRGGLGRDRRGGLGRDRRGGLGRDRRGGLGRDRRFGWERDSYRRPRRSFNNRRDSFGERTSGTRLFVKDLPKTVSNNDLRVLKANLGNI